MQGMQVWSLVGELTKIPHAVVQLKPHAATTEPAHSRARAPQLESTHAATTEPMGSGARVPQLESSHAATTEPACPGAHTLQWRACVLQRKIPHAATKILRAATKTWHSQINK